MPHCSQFETESGKGLIGTASDTQPESFSIKRGYHSRHEPNYFKDSAMFRAGVVYQPQVYELAAFLGRRLGCSHIIDIGCGSGEKLAKLHPEFKLVGIDFGTNLLECRSRYPFGEWIEWNLEVPSQIPLKSDVLSSAIIICSDVIEHLLDPSNLLKNLKTALDIAPAGILSTPERDLVRGQGDVGPPANPAHVREWNLAELKSLLVTNDFRICFAGLTLNNDRDLEENTSLVVLGNSSRAIDEPVLEQLLLGNSDLALGISEYAPPFVPRAIRKARVMRRNFLIRLTRRMCGVSSRIPKSKD